ncbi:MAG: AMP-binding protein [Candidatus Melainabacteria bacterium]|nr:AMP-binding protein [Candidatus Melainabacteria bacterium]
MVLEARDIKQQNLETGQPRQDIPSTLRTLIDGFPKHANNVALVSFAKDNSYSYTYKPLYDLITSIARGLHSQGVKKGDNLLFYAPTTSSWIISALAGIYCGATVVPLDPQHADEILRHSLKDCNAGWLFTDEAGAKKLKAVLPPGQDRHRIIRLDQEDSIDGWRALALAREDIIFSQINTNDTAVLFYTSGTTGMPKGVPLSHANMLLQLEAIAGLDLLRSQDRVLLPLPLFHVYPLNIGLMAPLRMGLTVVLPYSLTGPEIMRAIKSGSTSVVIAVPRLMRSLYEGIAARLSSKLPVNMIFAVGMLWCQWMDRAFGLRPGKLLFAALRKQLGPDLRLFCCGGAPLEESLCRKIRALGFKVAVGYGLTETSPLLTIRMPDDGDLNSVGTPIPLVEVRIEPKKNPKKTNECTSGEILARGANVFSGYRNLPDLDRKAFTNDGWFRTGDLGYFKDGHLHVLGRASTLIVMEGGEKLQPENLEETLTKHPSIAEMGVLQIDHKLVALIVPNLQEIGDRDVKAAISQAVKDASANLASYMQITSFATTNEPLPRTNLGKLKRHELSARFSRAKALMQERQGKLKASQAGAKAGASPEDEALLAQPQAAKCMDWLKSHYAQANIDLDTSPQLDLGIDSLEWLSLTLELAEHTGVELSADAISKVSTVRGLLQEVVEAKNGGEKAPSPLTSPQLYLNEKQTEYLKPLTPVQSKLSLFLYKFNQGLMSPFKVQAIGLEHLQNKQIVFVPNHTSYIDAFALAAALPLARLMNTQWAGWTGIAFGNPIFSALSRLTRVFPIEAKQSLFASLALAASVLKAGDNLVWFPEGERTLDGRLLPFKHGIGLLLQKSEVTVVPVFLDGTGEALPPGSFFPRMKPIRVLFGATTTAAQLEAEGPGKEPAERIANALQKRVEVLSKSPRGLKAPAKDPYRKTETGKSDNLERNA